MNDKQYAFFYLNMIKFKEMPDRQIFVSFVNKYMGNNFMYQTEEKLVNRNDVEFKTEISIPITLTKKQEHNYLQVKACCHGDSKDDIIEIGRWNFDLSILEKNGSFDEKKIKNDLDMKLVYRLAIFNERFFTELPSKFLEYYESKQFKKDLSEWGMKQKKELKRSNSLGDLKPKKDGLKEFLQNNDIPLPPKVKPPPPPPRDKPKGNITQTNNNKLSDNSKNKSKNKKVEFNSKIKKLNTDSQIKESGLIIPKQIGSPESTRNKKEKQKKQKPRANKKIRSEEKESKNKESFFNSQSRIELNSILEKHQEYIIKIMLFQFQTRFNLLITNIIVHPNERKSDFSDQLIEPFINYKILQNKFITEKQFLIIMKPFYQALSTVTQKPLESEALLSLLATVLNFGIEIGNEGMLYTTAYIHSLLKLEPFISKICFFISQDLSSKVATSIDVDNLISTDLNLIKTETEKIKKLSLKLEIPEVVIKSIITETCHTIDIMIYNFAITNEAPITESNINKLRGQVESITQNFNVSIESFHWTNYFITTVEKLIDGRKSLRINEKNVFIRLIAERIQPRISLPHSYTFEFFGPLIDDKSQMCITNTSQSNVFSFEWLFDHLY